MRCHWPSDSFNIDPEGDELLDSLVEANDTILECVVSCIIDLSILIRRIFCFLHMTAVFFYFSVITSSTLCTFTVPVDFVMTVSSECRFSFCLVIV